MTRSIIGWLFKLRFSVISYAVITVTTVVIPSIVSAQQLEEIVVTAQRREQSLQEVPISIEVITGETIALQGFRNLDDMAKFSPTVRLELGVQEQDVTIRGLGTPGNNNVLMSATPIILDGIYFGRNSLVKTAFMDTGRLEILKGPQPLFYGLNATAGAFNIISKRPTPEWASEISFDYGNDGKQKLFGAIGGPLTDTIGIRVAALKDRTDGPVKNNVDITKKISGYDNSGGRLTLEWTPNDKFTGLLKGEFSKQKNGSELRMGCLTEGPASGYTGRAGPLNLTTPSDDTAIGLFGYGAAVLAPLPSGIPYSGAPIQKLKQATGTDCFSDEYGMSVEGPYPSKPSNITGEETNTIRGGAVAFDQAADAFWSGRGAIAPEGEDQAFYGPDVGGIVGADIVDSKNAALDLTYTLDNGFSLNSLTGVIDYHGHSKRNNSPSPFLQNYQVRSEENNVWSQQVMVESPQYDLSLAGGSNLDFIVGGIWQEQNIDTFNYFPKDSVRRGDRTNVIWEDTTWYSAFWNMNLGFMEDQFSIQVGGRFTDVTKQGFAMGAAQQWIFQGRPCLSTGTDANTATCALDPNFKRVHPELTSYTTFDSVTGRNSTATAAGVPRDVRVDSPILLIDNIDRNDLWTPVNWNQGIGIPLNYRSPLSQVVGRTAPVYTIREGGPYGKCDWCVDDLYSSVNGYDSQIVLSFTPNGLDRNHTFYGKYAEAFKGPAWDLAPGTISPVIAELAYDAEYSEIWEVGAKGSLMESRLRYDTSVFITTFTDLQYAAAGPAFVPPEEGQASLSLNAGEQQVKGMEFNLAMAVTDNLTVNFAGGLMKGKIHDFDGGGCTPSEQIAASIDALTPTAQGGSRESRTAAEITLADTTLNVLGATRRASLPPRSEIPEELMFNGGCRLKDELDANGIGYLTGTIDRSNEDATRTPEWSFALGLDYNHPLGENYTLFFNTLGTISDGYITEETTFTRDILYNTYGDINLTTGIGDQDRRWRVLGYARNILKANKSYQPEYDLLRAGLFQTENVPASAFLQYGVRFEYNFR